MRIRINNTFKIVWTIKDHNGDPYSLPGKIISLYLNNRAGSTEIRDFNIEGNVLTWIYQGKDQTELGPHSLVLKVSEGEDGEYTLDQTYAFELTPFSRSTSEISDGSDRIVSLDGMMSYVTVRMEAPTYNSLTKISDYLWESEYGFLDYAYAKAYFEHLSIPIATPICTSVVKGTKYGRNLDWYYSNEVDVLVKTKKTVGIAGGIPGLTKSVIEADKNNSLFRILPFFLQEGMNKSGVFANINVVNADASYGPNFYSTPAIETRETISALMLVRYILDNFDSAATALDYINKYVSIAMPVQLIAQGYECHWMVGDTTDVYIVEIINGAVKTIYGDIESGAVLSNFYVWGTTPNANGKYYSIIDVPTHLPSSNGLKALSSGIERYNLAIDGLNQGKTMRQIMDSLLFSQCYTKEEGADFWYSEYVGGTDHVLGIDNSVADYEADGRIARLKAEFANRDRNNPVTWHTTHSCVYDLATMDIDILAQETDSYHHDGLVRTTAENVSYNDEQTELGASNVQSAIEELDNKKQDVISDLETIRNGAALGATAIQSVPDEYATKAYVDAAIESGKELFVAEYDVTSPEEIEAAWDAGKLIICNFGGLMYLLTSSGEMSLYNTAYFCLVNDNVADILVLSYDDDILDFTWSHRSTTLQRTSNLVTSFGATPSDTKYPSEKLVKDSLDNKVDKEAGKALSTNDYTNEDAAKLQDLPTDAELTSLLGDKVDKVSGKGLSTNDYTDADKAIVDGVDATYAKKDGYYSQMGVGVADNLAGKGDGVPSEFTRRTTGGDASVADGVATLKAIKGNTIVWNQQVEPYEDEHITTSTSTSYYFNLKSLSRSCSLISGHKYIIRANIYRNLAREDNSITLLLFSAETSETGGGYVTIANGKASGYVSKLFTANADKSGTSVYISNYDGGRGFDVGDVVRVKDCNLIDLTQMFGAGNEPSTVEEFEALFPNDYYPYNAGQLLPFKGTDIVTNGFNQWDEEWEVGGLNSSGLPISGSNRIRSKNFCPCFPNTAYHKMCISEAMSKYYLYVSWYDADKNFISQSNDKTQTSPANAAYFKIVTNSATYIYGNVYNNDICINLSWSGYRNGEYEPYWKETKSLPSLSAFDVAYTGADGEQHTEGGLKSAGSVYDEQTFIAVAGWLIVKNTRRIGVVDLGTLNWASLGAGKCAYYCSIPGALSALNLGKDVMLAAPYNKASQVNGTTINNATEDKVWIFGGGASGGSSSLAIRDTAYANASAFKSAMAGVLLFYPLADPVETEGEAYNPNYRVSDFGTETILPEDVDEAGVPKTAPFNGSIVYGLNAVDTLRNLPKDYISKDSMDAILAAFVSAGIIAGYTLTFDTTSGKYACTITPNAS